MGVTYVCLCVCANCSREFIHSLTHWLPHSLLHWCLVALKFVNKAFTGTRTERIIDRMNAQEQVYGNSVRVSQSELRKHWPASFGRLLWLVLVERKARERRKYACVWEQLPVWGHNQNKAKYVSAASSPAFSTQIRASSCFAYPPSPPIQRLSS